jgi:hypothetical protein
MRLNKGQSTVEYILLVTAVVTVIIIFMTKNGLFQQRLTTVFNSTTQSMVNVAGTLSNSM